MDLGAIFNGVVSGISSAVINFTNLIVDLVIKFVTWLLTQIPTLPIWPGPDAGVALSVVIARLAYDIQVWQYYINLGLALLLVPIIVSAELTLVAFNIFRKLIAMIPFLSAIAPGDTSDGGATGFGVYPGDQNPIAGRPVP